MVPSEYRLEQVAARLTERLESTRRSYADDPERAAAAFERIADEVVENAIAEYRRDGFVDQPERHAELLRAEIHQTFLPRYTRLATRMTAQEESGYGVGPLYGPVARTLLLVVGLGLCVLLLRAPGAIWLKLIPMLPLLAGPFLPDLIAWLARRRYQNQLVDTLTDLRQIQERSGDYAPMELPGPTE